MIAVACGTTREAHSLEFVPHLGLRKELGNLAVASATGVGDRVHLRWCRAVITEAIVGG